MREGNTVNRTCYPMAACGSAGVPREISETRDVIQI
jgi:hypothetical protein